MADDVEVVAGADDVVRSISAARGLSSKQGPASTSPSGHGDHAAAADQRAVACPSFHLDAERVRRWLHLAGADDEAAALVGDVAHAALPDVALVHGRRAPDVEPLAYMAVRRSGIWFSQQIAAPMRPAAFRHRQCRAVALSPDQTLHRGRHRASMLRDQPLRIEKKGGAIECRARALDDADDQTGVRRASSPSATVSGPSTRPHSRNSRRNAIAPFRQAIAKPRAEISPFG